MMKEVTAKRMLRHTVERLTMLERTSMAASVAMRAEPIVQSRRCANRRYMPQQNTNARMSRQYRALIAVRRQNKMLTRATGFAIHA